MDTLFCISHLGDDLEVIVVSSDHKNEFRLKKRISMNFGFILVPWTLSF